MVKMSTGQQIALDNPEEVSKLRGRIKRLWLFVGIFTVTLSLFTGLFVYFAWHKTKALSSAIEDLRFNNFVEEDLRSTDYVTPSVNSIQFLHRGYSITFDTVRYTQDGLVLSGEIGNSTELWITSLALTFTARPYAYNIRDKWAKVSEPWPWWNSDWDIGTAQTAVAFLNPGRTTSFAVTIPNVKQTSDNIRIAVSFSGERYQYLGGVR
jgi:hypothetical protein